MPPTEVEVPLGQVQGIILRGYELLYAARFLLLEVREKGPAKQWLRDVLEHVTDARKKPTERAVNLAFTYPGLEFLELDSQASHGFSREFIEGMDTPHRQRILGDTGRSKPACWDWGQKDVNPAVHAILMLYAKDEASLEELHQAHAARLTTSGWSVSRVLVTTELPGRKEQFGFRDGIAQPFVAGVRKEASRSETSPFAQGNVIKSGEFLLGFDNEYDKRPVSPGVPDRGKPGLVDFGYCGSYLVFRQLSQDVRAFWRFLHQATERPGQSAADHAAARFLLAAKMVGRWPGGAPLSLSPDRDDSKLEDADEYSFYLEDSLGTKVPIGSHTRRSNPRDSLEPGPGGKDRLSRDESLRVSRLHRMIRRGRPFGLPLAPSMDPADILASPERPNEADQRGLHFLCFNASISRQFEFVQQTWINNPKFGGMYRDSDPLMGRRAEEDMPAADTFTAQGEPLRRRIQALPEFVHMRGGAYFFMPGMEALKYLAGLEAKLPAATSQVEPS